MKRIVIVGSALGGGAGQIIEALQGNDSMYAAFILDRDVSVIGKKVMGVNVIGDTEEIVERWNNKEFDEVIIAIGGDLNERKRLFEHLTSCGIEFANIIDPDVRLGIGVTLGKGNVILNNTYVGNNSIIGNNNYILNQCSVQHDTVIGDHNYFSTNSTVGAKVKIGSSNRLGIK
jgi:NDP-sugar pyrophosphorylase family protein